jgi:ABC-2 type transport system ATP-binding protein
VDLFRAYYPSPLPTDRAIALAGLEPKAGARIGTLSGGERQRLYFALAVCGDPEALFLDEPTVGMDVEARRGVLASIRALSSAGKTIVLTTHYLEEADQLAHRIVVIDHGVVIADATQGDQGADPEQARELQHRDGARRGVVQRPPGAESRDRRPSGAPAQQRA